MSKYVKLELLELFLDDKDKVQLLPYVVSSIQTHPHLYRDDLIIEISDDEVKKSIDNIKNTR